MQAVDRFEVGMARRLRAELDALEVRLPAPAYRLRGSHSLPPLRVMRPLAFATAALVALAALATAVTRSPDPARWVQPSVWMQSFGIAPASPTPSSPRTDEAAPSESPEAQPAAEPTSPEREPSESPGTSSREHESPEPRESQPPSTGGSSPPTGEGPDG